MLKRLLSGPTGGSMASMTTKRQSPAKTKSKPPPEEAPKPKRKRQVFDEGHRRKFLVVVDETPECESALAFAASRALRTTGHLALLYVVEPGVDFQHWLGVEEIDHAFDCLPAQVERLQLFEEFT